jgi:translation elongation factor EF-Ts
VRDHLADELIYAYTDWSLEQAAEAMTRGGFRHVMVLDREEARAAARRYFGAGPCCAPVGVLAEVEETLARGVRVRLAAYSPSSLTRLDLPAPVVCSRPAPARLLGEGDQAPEVALHWRSRS